MSRQVTVAIAGLGNRGKDVYAPFAEMFPERMKIVAIADPVPERIGEVARRYHISSKKCFESAEEMLKQDQLADVVFITTQDRQHAAQAIKAMEKGYDILLEKPISPSLNECQMVAEAAEKYGRKVVVCHVLRYTPFYQEIKRIIDSGAIGEIVSVMGIMNVGYWHQAHSFVRGNWANCDVTSPMILQKCCHDMDLYLWLTGKTCRSVSSFGNTYHFKKENAPAGAACRCMKGCKAKEDCIFDAEKIYLTNKDTGVLAGNTGWPAEVLSAHPDEDSIRKAIEEGPYGKCVYDCDNNVVDHQIVNMEMTDGATMSLAMSGFTPDVSRYTKFMGTRGQIIGDMGANMITLSRFGKEEDIIDVSKLAEDFTGHGGGERRMVEAFLDLIIGNGEADDTITSVARSIESHAIALAAEESRQNGGKVICLDKTCQDRNGDVREMCAKVPED